jgi:hypothetical protein
VVQIKRLLLMASGPYGAFQVTAVPFQAKSKFVAAVTSVMPGVVLETVIEANPAAFVCAVVALWLADAEPINPKVTDWFASGAPEAFVTVAEMVTV